MTHQGTLEVTQRAETKRPDKQPGRCQGTGRSTTPDYPYGRKVVHSVQKRKISIQKRRTFAKVGCCTVPFGKRPIDCQLLQRVLVIVDVIREKLKKRKGTLGPVGSRLVQSYRSGGGWKRGDQEGSGKGRRTPAAEENDIATQLPIFYSSLEALMQNARKRKRMLSLHWLYCLKEEANQTLSFIRAHRAPPL